MKKIALLLILNLSFLLFHSPEAKAQNVYIPDSMFKKILVNNPKINTNGDTAIQVSEAVGYKDSIIVFGGIKDLKGIEAFTALTYLDCSYQQLTSLDISANTALTGLSCSFNQLTSLNVSANTALTYLNCSVNQLSSLNVSANAALTGLGCMDNQLTSLDVSANMGLTYLYCSGNQLTNLNLTGSTALVELFCSNNQIISLDISADSALYYLDCYNNQLTSLNVSANTALEILYCAGNQLTSLDVSADSVLTHLDCSDNQLTSLNVSANKALGYLHCGSNQLTSLNVSANSVLYDLNCGSNKLTSLNISANSVLTQLDCSSNPLTSLNVSANAALTRLGCEYNQLTSLNVSANMALTSLGCSHNLLTNLDVSANVALTGLGCLDNQLTSLNLTANVALTSLYCGYNKLTSLDISANTAIAQLNCRSNQLTTISQVPNIMSYFMIDHNNITCLSNLPQVTNYYDASISNNALTCVPNQTNYSYGFPLCVEGDITNNPNNCQSVANIVGNVFTDLDSNCTYKNSDWNTQNIPVKLYDNQNKLKQISYTINGVYSFSALQPDSFNVKINDALLPIAMACGQANTQTVHLDSTKQTITNIDFPVSCDSAFDMQVHAVTRQGWVHPGQVHTVNTNLANDVTWYNLYCGSKTYSGTVTINVSGPVTYVAPVNGALTPQVSGNTFTYAITDFNTLTTSSFGLKLVTDTTAQTGNKICVHVAIKTTPTDADTTNNTYDFCYNVTNSYDPNLKEVYPIDVLPGYNDWFTYTIHFQNTGTAPAFNIRLRDTLDTQVDLNTFEFLGASHTATTALNGNILSVRFNNIMLPDSTTDHNGSMGYYQYRIKPKANLLKGSNIKNTAYIYFDYNPAIVTNTTQNHFDIATSASNQLRMAGVLQFYPNPTNSKLTISGLLQANQTINISNIVGETVQTATTNGASKVALNVSNLPSGLYFISVGGRSVKFIKE